MKNTPANKFSLGFTLIELLVVISIISLLSSIVLASLRTARVKARDVKRIEDLQQIKTALELYFNDHNFYPGLSNNTVWDTNGYYFSNNTSSDKTWSVLAALLMPYMTAFPVDPINNCANNTAGPFDSDAPCYSYAYGNVGRNGFAENDKKLIGYDLSARLEDASNPLRCGATHMPFYFAKNDCAIYISGMLYSPSQW